MAITMAITEPNTLAAAVGGAHAHSTVLDQSQPGRKGHSHKETKRRQKQFALRTSLITKGSPHCGREQPRQKRLTFTTIKAAIDTQEQQDMACCRKSSGVPATLPAPPRKQQQKHHHGKGVRGMSQKKARSAESVRSPPGCNQTPTAMK